MVAPIEAGEGGNAREVGRESAGFAAIAGRMQRCDRGFVGRENVLGAGRADTSDFACVGRLGNHGYPYSNREFGYCAERRMRDAAAALESGHDRAVAEVFR